MSSHLQVVPPPTQIAAANTSPLTLINPRIFVKGWLAMNNININEQGVLNSESKKSKKHLFDSLWLDYKEQITVWRSTQKDIAEKHRTSIITITEDDMRKALDELISTEMSQHRINTIEKLKCETEDLTEMKKWVSAIVDYDIDKITAVMAHFIWIAKRKMNGLEAANHIMPIIYGNQHSGKTDAIKYLIAPIKNYVLRLSMNKLTDERYFHAMSTNYIGFCDELAGIERTHLNHLKNQITTEWNSARVLGTHDVETVRQSCAFAACTNTPTNELVYDKTGMRRFFELRAKENLDWPILKDGIDYFALWKGVDEKREYGYTIDFLTEISADQKELVAEDEIVEFIDAANINLKSGAALKDYSSVQVFQDYREYCGQHGIKPLTSASLGRKLKNKGMPGVKKTVNGVTRRYYCLNSDCLIGTFPILGAK